jgi:hypothetical protein
MRLGVPGHTPKFEAKPAAPLLPALSDGGQRSSARLAIEQADDDVQHDRTPLFDRCQLSRSSFQDRFADAGKWFRRPRQVERFQARALQRRRFYCQSAPAHTSPAFSVSVTSAVLPVGRPLPVYPQLRTSTDRPSWSGSCQQEKSTLLFDHFVGACEHGLRNRKAERLGGF